MKSRFMKAGLMAAATVSTVAAMSATAFAAVTLSHPSSNQIMATTTNTVDRIVLAEFDLYGRMTNLTLGTQGEKSVTGAFTMDQKHQTKIMQFSAFDSATALEEVRLLGSKTLGVWQGSDGVVDMAVGSLDPYGSFSAGATCGVISVDTDITCTNTGSSDLNTIGLNWFHIPLGTASTNWTVAQWDMTIHDTSSRIGNSGAEVYLYNGSTVDDGYQNIVQLKPATLGWSTNMYLLGNGTSFSTETKMTFAVAVNRADRKIVLYKDGTQVGQKDLSMTGWDLSAIRFHLKGTMYNFSVDNILVYEGIEPRSNVDTNILRKIAINESVSMYNETYPERYDDSKYTSQLNGKKAIHATTGVVYTGSEKVILTNLPYKNSNGDWMVPINELQSVLGITCGSTSESVTKNGVAYVSIDNFLQGQTYDHGIGASDNDNLYVLGTSSFATSNADDMNDYMLYYRPSKDDILELYNNSELKGEHPRLMATHEDFDRLRTLCQKHLNTSGFSGAPTYDSESMYYADNAPMFWLRRGLQYANARMADDAVGGTPVFKPSGSGSSRMNYQRYLASDLHAFGWAWQITQDPKYAEAAWEDLAVVCDFSELNLSHKLDVSEAMAALAIGYDWLYDYWVAYDAQHGTNRLETLETAIYNLGLYVSWQGYSTVGAGMGTEFFMENNHGTVANSAATMLALAMMDVYPEESAWIASQAIKGMELTIDKWDTGMWYEGASYWELTMQHTVKFLDALDGVLGTDFGFSNLEGLSDSAMAEMMVHAPGGIYNFGDANKQTFYVPELVWLANRYDQQSIARELGINLTYRTTIVDAQWQGEDYALFSLWYNPEAAWEASDMETLDYVNEDLDIITARNNRDWENYVFFAAKGGNDPKDGHAHLDTGSFVFEANGVRWANDLGMGAYNDSYFNATQRWLHLNVRGEAHNTIIDNANTSGADQNRAYADLTLVKKTDNGVIATVDMKPALSKASSATRGFFFTDNRQSLVVRDEIKTSSSSTLYWTMMLPKGCTITDNGNGSFLLSYTVQENEHARKRPVRDGGTEKGCYDSHTETLLVEYAVSSGTVGTITQQTSDFTPISTDNILNVSSHNNGKLQIPITASSGANVQVTVKLTPGSVTDASALSTYTNGISTWNGLLN